MAAEGTEHSATTVRFQETEFHWPLFGNAFEEVVIPSAPNPDLCWSEAPMAGF